MSNRPRCYVCGNEPDECKCESFNGNGFRKREMPNVSKEELRQILEWVHSNYTPLKGVDFIVSKYFYQKQIK